MPSWSCPSCRSGGPIRGLQKWAWLFVHAPELTEVPADLPLVYREALALANKATFTQEELDAYEKVRDEIQQVLAIAEAKLAEGEAVGFTKGHMSGKAEAIAAILVARGIALDDASRARITGCSDAATLDRWLVSAISASSVDDLR